jgi:predicted nucleic acid-binding protein
MVLLDVNVLVYAHRQDATDHQAYLNWLENLINSDQAYGLSDLVLSSFIRISTHQKVFTRRALSNRQLPLLRSYETFLTVSS